MRMSSNAGGGGGFCSGPWAGLSRAQTKSVCRGGLLP
jgi:hypothetical protein